MKAKEIIPETLRRPDRENIPYGFGSGAPVGGGIPAGRIEPTLGQIGSQAAQSAARIKSVNPNQPLNAPGQNVWRDRAGNPMRSPGDKAQNIDDFVMQQLTKQKPSSGEYRIPPAPGERLAAAAGAAVPVAAGVGMYAAGSDKGAKPTSGQSTPPANQPPASSTPAASAPRPVTTPAARPATTAPAARRPQQGVVGSELGRLSGGEFASRADRLNQEKVDAILGTGYKAGSAAANTALRDYYKANPPESDAQRQALAQQIFNQTMERERARQQAADARQELERDNPRLRTEPTGSDNSTVTVPEDKNQLMRLMKLSGQR
jgi:hypothetical protein